ncbi:MAG: ribonuclease Z [Prevotella sp.]|nr:ribonuclease Z [Prevotella sp.]
MNPFKVHILGCGSALPSKSHNPSSQIVEIRGKYFMVDCGEGTQVQIRRSHVSFSKLYAVFISHIHGDHIFGLMGMLSTFGLQGRTAPFHVYAPAHYEALFMMEKKMFLSTMDYDIIFHPLDTTLSQVIYEDRSLTVETIPLQHRVPCCGFLFKEKPTREHFIRNTSIPRPLIPAPPTPVRAYAYCSDTRYIPTLGEMLRSMCTGSLTIYHEATYADDKKDNAGKYMHSTAREAAMVAKSAEAHQLLLGHYSHRYVDETVLLKEAQEVFSPTLLSQEGEVYDV